MSKYTTQLRYICEQKAGYLESTEDYITVINKSYDKIIHPQTALYDPSYAPVLYKKILSHYYFDEIAHETVGQFIMRLNTKLDEILPYYNQLYASAALEFNPLYDVDYTRTGNREDNNTAENTRTDDLRNHAESEQYDLYSDTPEGSLIGVDNETYLTTATKTDNTSDITNTGTQKNDAIIHNINEYFEHVTGKMGSTNYSDLLLKFRETFLNIDMMIINELKNLFMGVY